MSGRHMVRAVNGSLAGMANVCFLQWGSANISAGALAGELTAHWCGGPAQTLD
jgi:hypothetical protein